MKKNFYLFSVLFLLIFGMQEMFAQTTIVTQNFDTDPEWDGMGNTGNTLPNSTDYGYRNIEGITGVTEGDWGCIGGIFNRWEIVSYYADTDLNGSLDRTMTLRVAGNMKLENRETGSFDGAFYLGYFDATNPTVKNFFGIMIKEPANKGLFPFRGVVTVNEASNTPDIELIQLEKLDFDLTYTGKADGSGVMTGKLAGTDIYVTVPAGTGTFNSFGLMNGGIGDQTRNERTRNCYFDDLTYTKVGSPTSAVDVSVNQISIYPNPTNDMVYFRNVSEGCSIILVDLTGRNLLVKKASELNAGLSLQPFVNGIYMVKVMKGRENVKSFKVIKK